LAFSELEDFVTNSSQELAWDLICLQEMSAVGCRDLSSGHRIFSSPRADGQKSIGFIISAAYAAFVVADSFVCRGRSCRLDLNVGGSRFRLISSHLDPGTNLDDYECSVNDLEFLFCKDPAVTNLISVDAQTQVGHLRGYDNERVIGPYALGPRGAKSEVLIGFAERHDLCFANTYRNAKLSDKWTCHFFCRSPPKEIDFWMLPFSKLSRVPMSQPVDGTATSTDHRPVSLEYELREQVFQAYTRQIFPAPKPFGWQPEKAEEFSSNVTETLSCEREAIGCAATSPLPIGSVVNAISTAACENFMPRRRGKPKLPLDDPEMTLLRDLEQRRRVEQDSLRRAILSKDIFKLRRNCRRRAKLLQIKDTLENKDRKLTPPKQSSPVPVLLTNDDKVLESVQDRTHELNCFYSDLYNPPEIDPLPAWTDKVWSQVECMVQGAVITGHLVREESMALKVNKTCAEDRIVAEMIRGLDQEGFEEIAMSFQDRLRNTEQSKNDNTWNTHLVALVRKRVGALKLSQFRPIAILSVLYKLYSRCLLRLCKGKLDHCVGEQYAFRSGYQTLEPIFILRMLIERACEWSQPIFVADGDVLKAYDYSKHSEVCRSLQLRNVPMCIIASWIREWRRSCSIFKLDCETMSSPIPRRRSIPQGDPSGPKIFNSTLDLAAERFEATAQLKGWGVALEEYGKGKRVALIKFADNFWLVSDRPEHLEQMVEHWLECLGGMGWSCPLSDIRWCTTAPDNSCVRVMVGGQLLERTPRKTGFKCLGTELSFDNRCGLEFSNRVTRAWRAFWANKHYFLCRDVDIVIRIRLLNILVAPVLFWASGAWHLTRVQLRKLCTVQSKMILKMMGGKKCPAQTMEEYMAGRYRAVNFLRTKAGVDTWSVRALGSYIRWAGHVARLRKYDASRTTLRVLHYRNIEALKSFEKQNGNQGHCRRFRVWRWERLLCKYALNFWGSIGWEERALDKLTWEKEATSMALWLSKHVG